MRAATLSSFWSAVWETETAPEPPRRYRGPVFIGDAVVPWGAETLLLARLRQDAEAAKSEDQP